MTASVPLKLAGFNDELLRQIELVYDAEYELTELSPRFGDAARSNDLQELFRRFFRHTQKRILRLEGVFLQLESEPRWSTCRAAQGLVEDCEKVLLAEGNPAVKDAALIAAARRLRQQEIAGYLAALDVASQLGHTPLQDTLRQAAKVPS